MGNHLNFFYPYESKKPWHEDQLTRAFLVVLTYVPLAQSAFIEQIREKQRVQHLKEDYVVPPFHTQKSGIRLIETQVNKVAPDGGEGGGELVLSLLITDKSWEATKAIEKSDRGARYDGVLQFGKFIITMENKPYSHNVWEGQLHPALDNDVELEVVDKPVVLLWPDIIRTLRQLLVNGSLEVSQARLVDDFLQFVQDQFEYLNPFAKLSECEGSDLLIRKRLRALLGEIESAAVGTKGIGSYDGDHLVVTNEAVRRLYLRLEKFEEGPCVVLALYPGDVMAQAKAFFSKVDPARFLGLGDKEWSGDWEVAPNLHFQHIQKHRHWTSSPDLTLEEYFHLWHSQTVAIEQVERQNGTFQATYDLLLHHRLITEQDVEELDKQFVNRNTMRICPGFRVRTFWHLEEAVKLDDEGKFATEIVKWANIAAATWRETLQFKTREEV